MAGQPAEERMWRCCSGWLRRDEPCRKCGCGGPECPGVRAFRRHRPRVGKEEAERIVWLRAQGLTHREIAKRLHRSENTVSRILARKIRKSR